MTPPCGVPAVTWRLPSLGRVPASPVPRRQRYYEGTTTSHPRTGGRLLVSLPPPTRSVLSFVFDTALLEGRRLLPGPGLVVPAARSAGSCAWARMGSLRSPDDPSRTFALLPDPGRTNVPLPYRSHRCCPRLPRRRRLRRLQISGLTHTALVPVDLRFAFCVATHAQGSLPAGRLGLYREGVEPSGPRRKVSVRLTILPLPCHPDATGLRLLLLYQNFLAGGGIFSQERILVAAVFPRKITS